MKKLDLTLVCCYNNKEQLNNELNKTLDEQNVTCEKIFIDNTNNKFKSASQALNYGASLVKTKYVIFLHQDICFLNKDSLEDIYNYLVKYNDSIIGVAGVKKEKKGVYTSIVNGSNKKLAGEILISEPTKVLSLDECLIGMNIETYNKLKFDEINFDNWHLYAADICYNADRNNINVYVIPASIWHTSTGRLNHAFFVGIKRFKKKYKKDYNRIKTACVDINMKENITLREFRTLKLSKLRLYKKIRNFIKKEKR